MATGKQPDNGTMKPEKQKLEIPKFDPNRSPDEYDFGPNFISLYVHEPFLGALSANIVRCERWDIPTACIGFDAKNYSIIMGFNPEFMARQTRFGREWVIKHEIYHLCLQHILGRANTNRKMRQIFNIGADLSVNSLLGKEHMLQEALMPGMTPINCDDPELGELIKNFKPLESTEFYIEAIKKFVNDHKKECPQCAAEKKQKKQESKKTKGPKGQPQPGKGKPDKDGEPQPDGEGQPGEGNEPGEQGQGGEGHDHGQDGDGDCPGHGHGKGEPGEGEPGEGQGEGQGELCEEHGGDEAEYTLGIGNGEGESLDGHEGWGEVPEDVREILNEKVKDMMSEGVKRSQMKGSWGSVPASMQEMIQKLLTSEIDWKSILRHFIGRARSMDRDATIKRVNKKAPYIFPGVRRKTKAKLCFFIDQSGSMSDADVQLAMSAAWECSKETEIDVYNFDTSVDEASHQVWKRGISTPWSRTRSGGTDFNGVRDFVIESRNKGKWQGIAILSDGYAAKMGQMIGVKVIWLITPGGTVEYVREGDLLVKMKEERTAHIKR